MRSVTWLLLLSSCSTSPGPAPVGRCAERTVVERTRSLQTSLPRAAVDPCLVAEDREVALEVRDPLVETDERSTRIVRGHAALEAALHGLGGELSVAGPLRCGGDCCDVVRSGMTPAVTYLRRACFAYGGRLSLLSFARAR